MSPLVTALLIWIAFAVPIALAVGRMLTGGGADGTPPAPPTTSQPAGNHLVGT